MSQDRRRVSMMQPPHRRPFYGKNEKTYDICIHGPRRNPPTVAGVTHDHSMDNFSYDEEHIQQYEMPKELPSILPPELLEQSILWQQAGAALCTSLDRINGFSKEAMHYAYPEKSHSVHSREDPNQHASMTSTAVPSDNHPPPAQAPVVPGIAPGKDKPEGKQQHLPQIQGILGMESPPMTPFDSSKANTPAQQPPHAAPATMPDLMRINRQLSPLSAAAAAAAPFRGTFDPISWETYLGKFAAQLEDLHEARRRMRGYARKVNTVFRELSLDGRGAPATKHMLLEFMKWWGPMERIMVSELEARVARVETPELDFVRMEWEMMRVARTGERPVGGLVFPRV